jgi:hypothetical protein
MAAGLTATGAGGRRPRHDRRMPLRAGILTLAILLLAAAPARAAFDVTAFELTPSSTAAGAHAEVTIATSFTPNEQPRTVVFHLPPGLAGDPFATPRCSEEDYRADTCAAASKVGTVEATAVIGPVPVPQTATGVLYNLVPAGAEPARLGAVITSGTFKLFVPTTINARSSDGGLDSVVTDMPTKLGPLDLYTEHLSFTLHGRPAGGTGPFMRNPTSCRLATTTVEASSYGDPATKSMTSAFTPTDCGALAFEPHITGTVGARGFTARQAKPPVSTVITQGAEQAGQSSATVTLPPVVAPDLSQLGRACPADKAAARACPDSAKVGTVTAGTPLLAAPLSGSVYLVARGPGALPGLTIQLADPIPLRLDGIVALTPQGLKTTFSGLPDVPLASFRLDLAGGANGAFVLGSDLCAAPPPAIGAAFAAHSGAQFAESRPMTVAGCTPPPRVSAKITRLRTGKPTVRLSVAAAGGAPGLREVRLLLPNALTAKPKRARRGARAQADGKPLPRGAIRLTRDGELRVALPEGTRTLRARLSKGTLRVNRALARKRKPKRLELRVLMRDNDGARPPVTLKIRSRRR